ncbi:MAG TPA: sigma-70 family RNA polymerase sigma factor [Gemmataceae bacterium]|jgi:RNA polymerase sigma factor (sigma-70 family)
MSKHQAEIVLSHIRRFTAAESGPQDDRHLLERFAQQREEAAFAALLDRYGPMVLRVCRRVLHDAHEAEDAFQATFLILARKAGTIRRHQSLASWLYRVAYHVAVRARAGAVRREELAARLPRRPAVDPLAEVSGRELLGVLDEELQRMPEKYRAPLLLCYLEGHTQDEAARQLGWSPHVLRGRIERGRTLLRRRLIRRGLGLSAVLASGLLEQSPAPAAAPALLIARTLRAALSPSAGQVIVSAQVAALVESGMHVLGASKLNLVASVLLILCLAAAGGAIAALQAPAEKTPPAQSEPAPESVREGKKSFAGSRRDRLGDPLPAHALARLGTSRLRHGGWFTAMTYSPDGKTLASAAHDGTVRLWDAATGKALRLLGDDEQRRIPYSPSRWVFCLAFAPDGKRLAAGDHVHDWPAGALHIWDTATGKEERRFMAHSGGVFAVAFSPDGKTLASSGAKDGKLRLWDAATGKGLHVLNAGGPAGWLAFSADGKTLASAGGNLVRLWNAADGTERKQLQGHRDAITGMAFRPDGKELASVGKDKTLRLWNPVTGRQLECWTRPNVLHGVAFSPNGKTLATGGSGPIVLWNAATGEEERRLRHPGGEVTDLAFSPDGKTLATSTPGERCIRLWDLPSGEERRARAAGHHGGVGFVRFTPDGQALLSAGWGELEICRWKTESGECPWQLHRGRHPSTRPVDLAPGGEVLAAGTPSGSIFLVDALSGKELQRCDAHRAPVQGLAFSADGKTLASSANDKKLCLWDVASNRLQRSFDVASPLPFLRFSPDDKTLASAASAGPIELRDTAGGRMRLRLAGQNGKICALAYSPDSRWLAAGTEGGSVQVWDTGSGKKVCRLDGHPGYVFGVAFSHDGKTLATGSWMQLRLWETATGRERARFTDLEGDVYGVAFAPGDRIVATGGGDGSILLWDATGRDAAKRPTNGEVEAARTDLFGQDTGKAYRAVWTLASAPRRTIPWLKKQLKPVVGLDQQEINRLIRQLDDNKFVVREAAMRQLVKVVELAEPSLLKTLDGNPSLELRRRIEQLLEPFVESLPPPERVRQLRMLEVLEQIGTKEVEELLKTLAAGAPGVFLTREAKGSLDRLARRPTP